MIAISLEEQAVILRTLVEQNVQQNFAAEQNFAAPTGQATAAARWKWVSVWPLLSIPLFFL